MPENPILYIAARTDVGRIRGHNEDDFLISRNIAANEWLFDTTAAPAGEKGAIIVIADGMGGEDAGEVAAKIAVDTIKERFAALPEQIFTDRDACNFMESVVMAAHHAITADALQNNAHSRMGTTVVMAWILNQSAHIAWVGDSRCYLLRQGRLSLLTDDHAPVWDMVRKGKISAEEARAHPDSNFISQHLGQRKDTLKPDVKTLVLQDNDLLLLCSDGLNSMLSDAQIEGILHKNITVQVAAAELVNAANAAGGYDNITVALVKYNGDEQVAPITEEVKTGIKTANQNLDDLLTTPIASESIIITKKPKSNFVGILVLLLVLVALAWAFKTFVWDTQPSNNYTPPANDIIEQAPPGTSSLTDTPAGKQFEQFHKPTTTQPLTQTTATTTIMSDAALKNLIIGLVIEKNSLKRDIDNCVESFKRKNILLNADLSATQSRVNGLFPRFDKLAKFTGSGDFVSWKINTQDPTQIADIYQIQRELPGYRDNYNRLCTGAALSPNSNTAPIKPAPMQPIEPEKTKPNNTPAPEETPITPVNPDKKTDTTTEEEDNGE